MPEQNKNRVCTLSNLTIDIGNTRTKSAVFHRGVLVERFAWETCSKEHILEVATNHPVKNVILSVVGPAPGEEWITWLRASFRVVELSAATPLPFQNGYDTPETLGKDRLAAVAGALARRPGQNCLVIDAGTCITYDVLTAEGVYVGGNISPGINLRFKALPAFTANLPLVERGEIPDTVGRSTETAIRNGVQLGAVWEMEGMIAAMRQRWEGLNVLLTGGDADFFEKNLKTRIFAHSDLVLEGLNKILIHNVQHS